MASGSSGEVKAAAVANLLVSGTFKQSEHISRFHLDMKT